jgi:RIO-like serine/threonine protein kinase
MFDSLKLTDLSKERTTVLRPPSNTRPAVWFIKEKGFRAVVKDFSVNRFFYRNIFGRFLVWREAKALKKLRGLKGVPGLFRVIGGLCLVIEEIPGKTLKQVQDEGRLPDGFFDDLRALVDRFHEKGVAHCDLKRAENILLGYDGRPYVIDWAASISRSEFGLPLLDLIYKRFMKDDYNAITKRKLVHSPELVPLEEREEYLYQSRTERAVRAFRDRLRAFLKKVA